MERQVESRGGSWRVKENREKIEGESQGKESQ